MFKRFISLKRLRLKVFLDCKILTISKISPFTIDYAPLAYCTLPIAHSLFTIHNLPLPLINAQNAYDTRQFTKTYLGRIESK